MNDDDDGLGTPEGHELEGVPEPPNAFGWSYSSIAKGAAAVFKLALLLAAAVCIAVALSLLAEHIGAEGTLERWAAAIGIALMIVGVRE